MEDLFKELLRDLDSKSFLLGFVAAGMAGWVLQRIYLMQKRVMAFFKPQPAVVFTMQSPAGVLAGCLGSFIGFLVVGLVIAGLVYLGTHGS